MPQNHMNTPQKPKCEAAVALGRLNKGKPRHYSPEELQKRTQRLRDMADAKRWPKKPLPIEHCAEYDAAAEWCARRGLTGKAGDPLPPNMATNGALRWIQADPEAFEQRVRETAYALAQTKTTKEETK